ncbi:U3 small nucleolar RNA-associated protein 6 homolog [Anoplolepis gracilipes]|uniref:U3 small nucleolar RNA-associated protein 6 homolog n=1 Tax=Anoplolepis gracilipes TaxID=354296 RepID=UPI003BA12484
MAEIVEKRCQDMIPELEHMEKLKLFDKREIRNIARKYKEYEYKIQRHTKCKEDYLRYIQYKMDLLKLIRQRRHKYGITQHKVDIEFPITNQVNNLYKDAILKFQDDIRFWIAYMKFCKHVHPYSNISEMLHKMLKVHRDKPKCWHIVARWELEENKNIQSARQYLLRGLQIHPESQLLYMDIFKLELENRLAVPSNNTENTENQEDKLILMTTKGDNEILKTAYIVYQQAFEHIKNIKFIVELLKIATEYDDTEKLQNKIISDMTKEYAHEPLMWDTMARRHLQGLIHPSDLNDAAMEIENSKQTSLRDRITFCNKVYQTAVKKIPTKEMWTLYIECLLEINIDLHMLPNFKKKLLKTALTQAHRAKKLEEKLYLYWFEMLTIDMGHDENVWKKFHELLRGATDAIPSSVSLWHARISHLLQSGQEKEVDALFPKVTEILNEKALPLWKMRILHGQIKSSKEAEESFRAALKVHPLIARDIKPMWLEWLVLTEGIRAARKEYKKLLLQLPNSLEFYKKMATLEYIQSEVSLKHARHPCEKATQHFGRTDKSIWMDYINFEIKYGDPEKVSDIYKKAVNTLSHDLLSSFTQEYSLMISDKLDSVR